MGHLPQQHAAQGTLCSLRSKAAWAQWRSRAFPCRPSCKGCPHMSWRSAPDLTSLCAALMSLMSQPGAGLPQALPTSDQRKSVPPARTTSMPERVHDLTSEPAMPCRSMFVHVYSNSLGHLRGECTSQWTSACCNMQPQRPLPACLGRPACQWRAGISSWSLDTTACESHGAELCCFLLPLQQPELSNCFHMSRPSGPLHCAVMPRCCSKKGLTQG